VKFPVKSVVLLLPLSLTACTFPFHKANQVKTQQTAPAVEETPPKPLQPPPEPLPPVVSVPKPVVSVGADTSKPPQKPKPGHRKPIVKPADQASADVLLPAETASVAPAPATPGVSAIGQLSSGEPSDLSRKTLESIIATERGLGGLNRKLSDAEQKTADHIREFLKQARVALTAGDVDGASTLAAKAKVLLTELSQ